MDDWLRNMGDWNISRKRYFGLPLPLYPCECGRLNVIGSRAELEERATGGLDQLQELHRPWIDEVPIRCDECGEEVRRIPEVGDAWLDAGIVPFSTLGWENPKWKENGYATGSSQGLSGADLPDHAYWETWFPADWVSEMREQIRLWFYSQLFMSVALVGKAPYKEILAYEKLRDETGKEMHKSWGNAIEANEAMDKMGADVMRFMYCDHVPQQNLNFGYGPAQRGQAPAPHVLELRLVLRPLREHRGLQADATATSRAAPTSRSSARSTAGSSRGRSSSCEEATDAYERFWTPDVTDAWERFTDDLSNWYIRRSRKRFYTLDEAAFRTLWYALVQAVRVIAPVMPFLAEHMWRNLAASVRQAPESAFLAGWPQPAVALRGSRAARRGGRRAPGRRARPRGARRSRDQAAPAAPAARRRDLGPRPAHAHLAAGGGPRGRATREGGRDPREPRRGRRDAREAAPRPRRPALRAQPSRAQAPPRRRAASR